MSAYISLQQLEECLDALKMVHPFFGMSYLAFKKARLPIGQEAHIVFSKVVDDILHSHYHVADAYEGFYNPFSTSDPSQRWLAPRYGSTSLQRITTDTFGDAFIHAALSDIFSRRCGGLIWY